MENLLNETVTQLLGVVLSGCVAIAGAYMTLFVSKMTQKATLEVSKLKDEQQQAILTSTLDKVDKLLKTNIIALEETVKVDMLESIKDGKVEKSELKTLAENVKTNVINQLGEGSVQILNDSLGDTTGYIEARLEGILAEIKGKVTE